ncbi:MAG: hypothetical protein H7A26_05820 [Spirochaetales bacterium]|nr:hypothetical protein [Spirochaetales bacterium]
MKISIKKVIIPLGAAGLILSVYSIWQLFSSSGFVLRLVLKTGFLALKICAGLVKLLFIRSLPVIWFPVLAYLVLSWFVRDRVKKKIFLFVIVSAEAALLVNIALPSLTSVMFALTRIPFLFCVTLQFYMFLLFLLPNELWNFLGGLVLFLKGSAVILLPDFPTFLDDIGILSAIFFFLFLYINTLLSIVKRIGKRESMETAEKFLHTLPELAGKIKERRIENKG